MAMLPSLVIVEPVTTRVLPAVSADRVPWMIKGREGCPTVPAKGLVLIVMLGPMVSSPVPVGRTHETDGLGDAVPAKWTSPVPPRVCDPFRKFIPVKLELPALFVVRVRVAVPLRVSPFNTVTIAPCWRVMSVFNVTPSNVPSELVTSKEPSPETVVFVSVTQLISRLQFKVRVALTSRLLPP